MIPAGKEEIVKKAKAQADIVTQQFNEGLLTEEERIRKHIEIWQKAKGEVEKSIPASLDKNGSVYDMVTSGARGSLSQITQMAGMKGLIASVSGETIEFPILSCAKEGLTPIEYFITTHGSRKGLDRHGSEHRQGRLSHPQALRGRPRRRRLRGRLRHQGFHHHPQARRLPA